MTEHRSDPKGRVGQMVVAWDDSPRADAFLHQPAVRGVPQQAVVLDEGDIELLLGKVVGSELLEGDLGGVDISRVEEAEAPDAHHVAVVEDLGLSRFRSAVWEIQGLHLDPRHFLSICLAPARLEGDDPALPVHQRRRRLARRGKHRLRVALQVLAHQLRIEMVAMGVGSQDQVDPVEGRLGLRQLVLDLLGKQIRSRVSPEAPIDEDLLLPHLDEKTRVTHVGDLERLRRAEPTPARRTEARVMPAANTFMILPTARPRPGNGSVAVSRHVSPEPDRQLRLGVPGSSTRGEKAPQPSLQNRRA